MKIRREKMRTLTRPVEHLSRSTDVQTRQGKTQTRKMTVSSEKAVERWFGMEVLSHETEHIRLAWFNSGHAPYLVDHETRDQIGVIEADSAAVNDQRKLETEVRYSRSARAKEISDDQDDGIRTNNSIGYRVYRYVRAPDLETVDPETGEPEIAYWRAEDWEPKEASTVPLPADEDVGTDRGFGEEYEVEFCEPEPEAKPAADPEAKPDPEPEPARAEPGANPITVNVTVTPDPEPARAEPEPEPTQRIDVRSTMPETPLTDEQLEELRKETRDAELVRLKEIQAIAARFTVKPETAEEWIRSGRSVDEIRAEFMANWTPAQVETVDVSVGMEQKDRARFSVRKAILGHVDQDWKGAGFEREILEATQEKCRELKLENPGPGFYLPLEVTAEMYAGRGPGADLQVRTDLLAGTGTAANLVGTEHRGDLFIDALRNRVYVLRAGATVLNGLQGNVGIPRQTAEIVAGISASEAAAFTEGAPTYDQVVLTPKIANAFQPFSRQLLLQSDPSIEALVRRDLTLGIGTKIDAQALFGTGATGEALGIANTTGIGAVPFAEADPTWALVVDLETKVADANADVETMAGITNSKVRGKYKTTLKATAVAGYIWDIPLDAPVNGYPTWVSNNVRSNLGTGTAFSEHYFGDFSSSMLGFWGGIFILVDPYTRAKNNMIEIVSSQHFDHQVRTPGSYSLGSLIKTT